MKSLIQKFKLRGKFKYVFFKFHLYIFFPSYILLFFGHMNKLSKWINKHKKNENCDSLKWKFDYEKREGMFENIIKSQNLNNNIDYIEFGVCQGGSFQWWINHIDHKDAKFYGFDTFTGLPEDWGSFKKGEMSNGNTPPVIDDNRHTFYQGLFQQTLIPFLGSVDLSRRKILHMDADLYSSTLYVLTLMTPYLKSGDIIFFDEFNVPMHEFKAFSEWTESFYIEYEVLGSVNNFYQTAIMIK